MRGALGTKLAGVLGLAALLAAAPADAPVADAAMRGDRAEVGRLLKAGADVNAAQGDGMTALHWAAQNGDRELAEVLVYAGAHLEAVTRVGAYRPLHVASRSGSGAVARLLLEAGSDAAAPAATGVGALHLAALAGAADVVAALADHGAAVDAREPQWGQTPLMFAAARGRLEAVRVLLERGADPSATAHVIDLVERAAADAAAREARNEVMAAFRRRSPERELWRPDPSQVQAAVRAARAIERSGPRPGDATEVVPEVGSGDEGNAGFTAMVRVQGGLTPLLLAVREGHADVAEALLDGGADLDQARPGDGTTPLLLAAINGHYDLAMLLLERGADPNLSSIHGAAPLYGVVNKEWAPHSRHPQPTYNQQQRTHYLELMEALLVAGADPNARLASSLWYTTYDRDNLSVDFAGATPLWRAAYGTDVRAMQLLVAHGADPSIPLRATEPRRRRGGDGGGVDPSGLPPVPVGGPGAAPIHAAAGAGYGRGYASNDHRHAPDGWLPSVRYLVEEFGADVNARDQDGFTPLHYAAARGDNELILYLVEHGADVTAVARTGQTTADMANGPVQRISPYLETVALLESLGAKNNHRCVAC